MKNHSYKPLQWKEQKIILVKTLFILLVSLVFLSFQKTLASPFVVTVDQPSRIIEPGGYTTFVIYIRNSLKDSVSLRVIRSLNKRPDTSWHISICSPSHCYDETVDTLEIQQLAPDQLGGASVHILAGTTDSAEVILSIDSGPGTETIFQTIRVQIGNPPKPPFLIGISQTSDVASPFDSTDFTIAILNTSSTPIAVALRRIENDFPDTNWRSVLCTLDSCLASKQNITSLITILPEESGQFRVRIIAGGKAYSQGKVEVAIDCQGLAISVYQRFLLTVIPTSSIETEKKIPTVLDLQ